MTIWLLYQKVYLVFTDQSKWNLLMLIRICTYENRTVYFAHNRRKSLVDEKFFRTSKIKYMTIWLLYQKVYLVFTDQSKWNLLMLIRICT